MNASAAMGKFQMKPARFAVLLWFVLWPWYPLLAVSPAVRVWEGKLSMPTYLLGEEDRNPPFPLVTRNHIYPYTMLDDLTDRREVKSYRAFYLENKYLKVIVLPELGGHLYSVYDKVSKREVLYRNNVVKYGLVAVRGAWISGGVEYNFPDGHTVSTVSTVSATWHQSPDGSATIVVGDVDRVTGMYWDVAFTLRPNRAVLEQHVNLFNATPLTNLYWYWANAAVPAGDDMQFIYPMREAYPHTKGLVWKYPINAGVDYSWYKNVREPTSLFARQAQRNFFGAYYLKSDYGVVHVADFREVPGKKYWTWGVADDGLIWTDLLTDKDGPYNEIQAGVYETQLNYEFIPPRRVESFTEFWYPVHGLGDGFVQASNQLALNVRFLPASGQEKSRLELAVSPVAAIAGPKIKVKRGSQLVREFRPTALAPLKTEKFMVLLDDLEGAKKDLVVEVESVDGQLLLRWNSADPADGNPDFVPAAGAPPRPVKSPETMTVEELFLLGVEKEKDWDVEGAEKIYEKVVELDPGYIPALLKLAWGRFRSADYQSAKELVARARFRNAYDPTAHYAAGVVYRAAGHLTLAQDAFWSSIRYGGPAGSALALLGELALQRKNYDEAVELLRRARLYAPEDALALTDLAAALRLVGKTDEAWKIVNQALEKMPLLPFALAERWRIAQARRLPVAEVDATRNRWTKPLSPEVDNYLEVGAWYRSLEDWSSSDAVLQSALRDLPAGAVSPLVYYYLASNARRQGRNKEAEQYASRAAAAPYEKVFPYRAADGLVLLESLLQNPVDAQAQYFLGNFLFAHGRYEDAARVWLQALGEGFEYSVLLRNLGLYTWRLKKDLKDAAGFYEKAVQLAPGDYRLYVDLDEIYFESGDTEKRAKLFAGSPAGVLERDIIRARRALLLAQQKQFDSALELLAHHRFKPWEGGVVVRQVFVLANLEKGREMLEAGNFQEAANSFRRAAGYPSNLGVGKPNKLHDEQALYWLGEALEKAGDAEGARAAWQHARAQGSQASGVSQLFAALSMRRLGKVEEADAILEELGRAAAKEKPTGSDLFVTGLLGRFRNDEEEARSCFRRALELSPTLWQARLELDRARP